MKNILLFFTGIALLFTMAGCLNSPRVSSCYGNAGSECVRKYGRIQRVQIRARGAPANQADDVRMAKTALECGIDPGGKNFRFEPEKLSINKKASITTCLERTGLMAKGEGVYSCLREENKNLPVCRPGAAITAPSVKMRLNSKYCKAASNKHYLECRP